MRNSTRVAMKAFDMLWRMREKEIRGMKLKKDQSVSLQYNFPCLVTYPGVYTPSQQGGVYKGKDLKMTYTTVDGKVVEIPFEKLNYSEQP